MIFWIADYLIASLIDRVALPDKSLSNRVTAGFFRLVATLCYEQ
jgi:hypothetical protein